MLLRSDTEMLKILKIEKHFVPLQQAKVKTKIRIICISNWLSIYLPPPMQRFVAEKAVGEGVFVDFWLLLERRKVRIWRKIFGRFRTRNAESWKKFFENGRRDACLWEKSLCKVQPFLPPWQAPLFGQAPSAGVSAPPPADKSTEAGDTKAKKSPPAYRKV